jgi:hypothetical protein
MLIFPVVRGIFPVVYKIFPVVYRIFPVVTEIFAVGHLWCKHGLFGIPYIPP